MLFKLSYLNSNFALTLGYLNPVLNKLSGLYAASPSVLLYEADIGGTQYCYTVRKLGKYLKYRVENRRNTDTAFMIGHAYLKLYPSRVSVYLKHVPYLFE